MEYLINIGYVILITVVPFIVMGVIAEVIG